MKKKIITSGLLLQNFYAGSYLQKLLIALILLLLAAPPILYSQKLDDFRIAANSEGVNTIPFSDLRRDATAISEEVENRKYQAKEFDFETLTKQKNNKLYEIKKKKEEIASVKKEIEDFKNRYKDGSTSSYEDEIKKKERAIDDINADIKELNNKMIKAADVFNRLYNARAGLREYFDKALSKLSDVRSYPDRYLGSSPTDDDRKKLFEYVKTIEDKINAGKNNHFDQEKGAKSRSIEYENFAQKTEPW